MELAFGVGAYQRNRGNLPELPLVNMFVESAKTEPTQVAIHSRPGLIDNAVTSGAGPVTGIYKADGVLSGALFTVSAGSLYQAGVSKGVVTGTGFVSMAGNEIGIAVNAGTDIHFYNGTTFSNASFPDSAAVAKIIEVSGRFIAIRSGTQAFYWTEPLANALVAQVLTFGALAYASSENEPDQLYDACVVNDKLVLGGTETVEFWAKTGDALLPYSPIEGMIFDKGIRATGCLINFDNSAVFISPDNLVYRVGNVPEVISDSGITERIAASATASLFTLFFEGHEFLAVRLATETLVMDAQTGEWAEWATQGQTNWIARCACKGPIFGSALDGKTLKFGTTFKDLDALLERRFRAGKALMGGSERLNNVRLRTNPGTTTYDVGQYADPVCEMRFSRDAGMTWSPWRAAPLGTQGKYRQRVEYRALGQFEDPGILVEFRVTDPVDFRVSGVGANEKGGGRAR